eukprot:GEMP01019596.1.p1 GENE.GEMP01019596.1~~GEMP01019596.1.p1  ORF type:complete len:704 (+),score=137.25 GEMP01019596.1:36-2147(+)
MSNRLTLCCRRRIGPPLTKKPESQELEGQIAQLIQLFRDVPEHRKSAAWWLWRFCEASRINCVMFVKCGGDKVFIDRLLGRGPDQKGVDEALQLSLIPGVDCDLRFPIFGSLIAIADCPEFRWQVSGSGILGIICSTIIAPVDMKIINEQNVPPAIFKNHLPGCIHFRRLHDPNCPFRFRQHARSCPSYDPTQDATLLWDPEFKAAAAKLKREKDHKDTREASASISPTDIGKEGTKEASVGSTTAEGAGGASKAGKKGDTGGASTRGTQRRSRASARQRRQEADQAASAAATAANGDTISATDAAPVEVNQTTPDGVLDHAVQITSATNGVDRTSKINANGQNGDAATHIVAKEVLPGARAKEPLSDVAAKEEAPHNNDTGAPEKETGEGVPAPCPAIPSMVAVAKAKKKCAKCRDGGYADPDDLPTAEDEEEDFVPDPAWVDLKALAMKMIEVLCVDHEDIADADLIVEISVLPSKKVEKRRTKRTVLFKDMRDHIENCTLWPKLADLLDNPYEGLRVGSMDCLAALWGPLGDNRNPVGAISFASKLTENIEKNTLHALCMMLLGPLRTEISAVIRTQRNKFENIAEHADVNFSAAVLAVYVAMGWEVKVEVLKRLAALGRTEQVQIVVEQGLCIVGDARELVPIVKAKWALCTWCGEHQHRSPKRCGSCQAVYCSERCQNRDWKSGHKKLCSNKEKKSKK